MRTQSPLFRLSAAVAVGGLVFGPLTAEVARAQAEATAQAETSAGDPPARVGRLASLMGTVSFHTAEQTQWQAATPNYPVTSGDGVWTEPGAGAAIEIGASHIALSQQTEFDVATLDDTALAATEPQGEVYLRIPGVQPGETYTIETPRGAVAISGAGRVGIVAGDTDTPTTVTVVDGSVQVTGPGLSLTVGAHQTATITGTEQFQGSVGAESDDAFLAAQLQQEAAATASATASYTPPPVVQEMTGAADLETQGSWADAPQYGKVWYPPVASDWVPYRDGHWANVAPWGWTWVDNARWGFAPFHYGRWVEVGGRWCWTPGEAEVAEGGRGYRGPVYAPALVSFVGLGVAVGVGLALSGALRGNIGWAPLGYREPYIPPYYVSRPYLAGINERYVPRTEVTRITNNYTHIYNVNRTVNTTVVNNYYGHDTRERFGNARAATFVPAAALARSQPVAQHVVHVTARQVAEARPLAAAPVRPTAPAVARPAPGPAVRPMPVRAPGQPGAAAVPPRPALVPRPATPPRPAPVPPVARPAGLPPLAPPRAALSPIRPGFAPGPAIVPHPAPAPRPLPGAVQVPALRPAPAVEPRPAPPRTAPQPPPRPAPAVAPHPAPPPPPRPAPAVAPRPSPAVAPRPSPAVAPRPAPPPPPPPRPAPPPPPRPAPPPPPRPAPPPPPPRPAPPPPPRPAPPPPPRPAPPPPPHRPCPPGVKAC